MILKYLIFALALSACATPPVPYVSCNTERTACASSLVEYSR